MGLAKGDRAEARKSYEFCVDVVGETSAGMVESMVKLDNPLASPPVVIPVAVLWHGAGNLACLATHFTAITDEEAITLGIFVSLGMAAPGARGPGAVITEEAPETLASSSLLKDVAPPRGVDFEGTLYRYDYPERVGTTWERHAGNIASEHRYSAPGEGAVYGGTSEATALREVEYYNVEEGRILVEKQVNLENVLDLTDAEVRNQIGVTLEEITAEDYSLTQELGAWAQKQGYEGILAPSARNSGGSNVIVFGDL